MAAGNVPTANINALYSNTTAGTDADPAAVDNAVQDIVTTINDNYSKQVNDMSAHAGAATLAHPDGSVVESKLATDSVGTAKIKDGNVTTAKIADGAVTTPKIADAHVTTAKIADSNVTTAKIADSAVNGSKLANGSVDSQHIAGTLLASAASLATQAEFDKRGFDVQNFGAKGDGTDATQAFKDAIAAGVSTGLRKIIVPDGTYLIDMVGSFRADLGNIMIPSNFTIEFSENAIMKGIPTSNGFHAIMSVYNAENVKIIGGNFVGDLAEHTGSTFQHGFGIVIWGSKNVKVSHVRFSEFWGDGINVWSDTTAGELPSENVTIEKCYFEHNRRNGISLTSCKHVSITDCVFIDHSVIAPGGGVVVESDGPQPCEDITISKCRFLSNMQGVGIARGEHVRVMDNYFYGSYNTDQIAIWGGASENILIANNVLECTYASGNGITVFPQIGTTNNVIQIKDNIIFGSFYAGIRTTNNCKNILIRGNQITGGTNAGIALLGQEATVSFFTGIVSDNVITDTTGTASGIEVFNISGAIVKGNKISRCYRGINAVQTDTYPVKLEIVITQNVTDSCRERGINTYFINNSRITENLIKDCNTSGSAAGDGMNLSCANTVISDNTVKGTAHRYGINIIAWGGPNRAYDNDLIGSGSTGLLNFTGTLVRTSKNIVDTTNDLPLAGGTWQDGRLVLGTNYLWVDATGKLRVKAGSAPTSDTDGTIVGTQA